MRKGSVTATLFTFTNLRNMSIAAKLEKTGKAKASDLQLPPTREIVAVIHNRIERLESFLHSQDLPPDQEILISDEIEKLKSIKHDILKVFPRPGYNDNLVIVSVYENISFKKRKYTKTITKFVTRGNPIPLQIHRAYNTICYKYNELCNIIESLI